MKPMLVDQIRAIAGAGSEESRFVIRRSTCDIHVECTWAQTILTTPFPESAGAAGQGMYRGHQRRVVQTVRPLELIPRKETAKDRHNKAEGVNREVQTGDPSFDSRVYLTSHADDEVIASVLADPTVREAILQLLETEMEQLILDDRNGQVVLWYGVYATAADESTGEQVIASFERLVAGLPALVTTGRRAGRWNWFQAIGATALVCLPGAVAAVVLTLRQPYLERVVGRASAGYGVMFTGAIVAGIALGLMVARLVMSRIRGKFDSAGNRKFARFISVALAVELGLILTNVFWWTR